MNTTGGLVGQWAQWMLHAGWQAAVVAIAAMILLTLVRRRVSPQMRFAVLYLALLKFAVPPFLIGSGALLETTGVFSSGDWLAVPSYSTEVSQSGFVNAGSLTESSGDDAMSFASVANESASNTHRQATNVATTATDSLPSWLLLLAIVYGCGVIASLLAVVRQFACVRQVVQKALRKPGDPAAYNSSLQTTKDEVAWSARIGRRGLTVCNWCPATCCRASSHHDG
jgi:multisubunit Na+/H+ antiporter MnhC subunit